MSKTHPDFIVIDDSELDCFISKKIIKNTSPEATVVSFIDAADALAQITNGHRQAGQTLTIILLDIQMPVMNGFDFAEAFEKLSENTQSAYAIYMITSSTNETDLIRVGNFPSIKRLYNKPLTKSIVLEIIDTSYTD